MFQHFPSDSKFGVPTGNLELKRYFDTRNLRVRELRSQNALERTKLFAVQVKE